MEAAHILGAKKGGVNMVGRHTMVVIIPIGAERKVGRDRITNIVDPSLVVIMQEGIMVGIPLGDPSDEHRHSLLIAETGKPWLTKFQCANE